MVDRRLGRWCVRVCLAAALLLCASGAGRAQEVLGQHLLYADLEGRVVEDATGAPRAGVAVSLLYETVITDAEGKFRFQKVPTVHTSEISLQISTDTGIIIGCTSFDIPVAFYPLAASDGELVDVQVVQPGKDENVELRLKAIGMGKLADYCGACHSSNPCAETATFDQVVKTGKELRGIVVKESELAQYREKLMREGLVRERYVKLRYQDTHADGMDMNQMVTTIGKWANLFGQPADLKLWVVKKDDVEYRYVVCDTCHTRHVPTAQRQFIVLPFEEDSALCYQCHQ